MPSLRSLIMEDNEKVCDKAFTNGDVYTGSFSKQLPHGKGKYTWSDGTVYQGDWEERKMTGKGRLVLSSGAKYNGDFSGGYLHGFGTFSAPDGSTYSGSWRMNVQHGIGRREYCNSDIYDGSWKDGVKEGSGTYSWHTGNTYIGNWKGGNICGRGVMKWTNGDTFDGFWLNGIRHGCGVYKFADGGYYFGMWTDGLKDGKGTFYPAGSKHPSHKKCYTSLGNDEDGQSVLSHSSSKKSDVSRIARPNVKRSLSERISMGGISINSGRFSHRTSSLDESWRQCDSGRYTCNDSSYTFSDISDEGESSGPNKSTVVYEREYMQGVLRRERVMNYKESSHKNKEESIFHPDEVTKRSCVNIFKSKKNYYLMLNLQFGIRYTVGKITPVPKRDVRASDFGDRARIRMFFPRKGSKFTCPHRSINFYWEDYCPMVFRNLREMFKLDAAEYMMSICGDDGLRDFSSPGKSGSIFYLSHDDRFVIKTLKRSELKVLLKMLPYYYKHVGEHENTLITKFFGIHRITLKGGRKTRFVVMGNMFCTELRIHRRYDLKGSSHGRYTDKNNIKESTTLKDLDLNYEFSMDKLLRESLFRQISLDCNFLESQHIIDYSLLLGLHFRAPEHLKGLLEPPNSMVNHDSLHASASASFWGDKSIPPKSLLLVTHEPNFVNTTPGPHIRGNTLRAYSVGEREVDLLLPGTARLRVQLGVNMPAQAKHKLMQDEVESSEIELFEVYDVVLYMGIIDILQDYSMKKRAEHAYKSLKFDPLSISVVQPKMYAKRFINFLHKVFPDQP